MALVGKLVITKGEAKGLSCIVKDGEEATIGRNLQCSIPVPDIKLSRIHCVLRNVEGTFELLDNNSTNGTYINKNKVDISQSVSNGDIITIGDTEIQFSSKEMKEI